MRLHRECVPSILFFTVCVIHVGYGVNGGDIGSTNAQAAVVVPSSKNQLRAEIRESMEQLRQQRDGGLVSEAAYREQKERLRQMGKTGHSTGGSIRLRGAESCDTSAATKLPGKGKSQRRSAASPKGRDSNLDSMPHSFEKVTWVMVKKSWEIDSIEDPVTGCTMEKRKFYSIFKEMLQDLDGTGGYEDSYMDFYFERFADEDVLTSTLIKFKSEERKADWVEWSEELGIQPTMQEIKAGETEEEKAIRETATDKG